MRAKLEMYEVGNVPERSTRDLTVRFSSRYLALLPNSFERKKLMMNSVAQAGRLWRTVRYMKPVQLAGRVRKLMLRSRIDLSPPPGVRQVTGTWIQPAARNASLVGPTRLLLLNRQEDLEEVGWDNPALPKLWRYNQHYFDDLNADGWRVRSSWHENLIAGWVRDIAPGEGTGWEPYPTSLRIVNWIKWCLGGGVLSSAAKASLAIQARWLAQRLERHLLGNHLVANGKALLFAGLFFEGQEADNWRAIGGEVIAYEIDEQFLDDGGHFELSTMYHALALEDLLDLINLSRAFPQEFPTALADQLIEKASAALSWLCTMSHPDGRISFFNDAAFGVAPENDRLIAYAQQLGVPLPAELSRATHLSASGYARLSMGPADLFVDFASVGASYIPGHAHADTLSFELSLFGQRLLVNSGTSEYGTGPERHRQRGTASHNTVLVAGRDSSEVWGGFRVGRRATVSNVEVSATSRNMSAEASHDGYTHLSRDCVHHRRFILTENSLRVEDSVQSALPAEARFHLHPSVAVKVASSRHAHLILPSGVSVDVLAEGGPVFVDESTWHPEFGRVEPSKQIIVRITEGKSIVDLTWSQKAIAENS